MTEAMEARLLEQALAAVSDRVNAEDLVSGPRTVTVGAVVVHDRKDSPVELDVGLPQPWLPCKTVTRLLVLAWGRRVRAWVGRRVTLYRDETVTFGGRPAPGIRVSHLSDLGAPTRTFALTDGRGGKRRTWTVSLLVEDPVLDLVAALWPWDHPAATRERLTDWARSLPPFTLDKVRAIVRHAATPGGRAKINAYLDGHADDAALNHQEPPQ